jgi:hypothetical protein
LQFSGKIHGFSDEKRHEKMVSINNITRGVFLVKTKKTVCAVAAATIAMFMVGYGNEAIKNYGDESVGRKKGVNK